MSDYDLGTARGKIIIDTSGAQQGFSDAQASAAQTRGMMALTGGQMMQLGGQITNVGLGIAGALWQTVEAGAEFEARISAIAAVSGATGAELDSIRAKALQLGADTKFSASESASAMEELIKAGLTTGDVLNGAADATVALAAAGEIDLPNAAVIASAAMNNFNLAAQDLPHVADLIAGAANASAIDVGDFGQSMQQAGAVANLVGLSFDDMAVAIAAMGNAGVRGSDAGTSLKTMLSNLQPTTARQKELMQELGLVTEDGANAFFDATGKIKPMAEIAGTLQGALAGMTDQQKQTTLETIFGSDAIRAAAVIADEGATGMNDLATAMGNVSATEVAETRMDNLGGSIEQMRGSMETFMITAGKPLQDIVRGIVDAITGFFNWLTTLNPELLKWIEIGAAVVAGLLVLVGAAITLAGAIMVVSVAFDVLAANPVVLIIIGIVAAIAALVAVIVLAYQHWQGFHDAVDAVWQGMQAVWDWITGTAIPVLMDLVGVIVDVAKVIIDVLGAAFEWLADNVFPIFTALGELVAAIAQRVVSWVQFIWPVFRFVFNLIATIIRTYVNIWLTIIRTVINAIMWVWDKFGSNIVSVVVSIFNIVKGVIETVLGVITGIIRTVTNVIKGDWGAAWNSIKGIFSTIWNGIRGVLENVINIVKNIISAAINFIKTIWTNGWNALRNILSSTVGGIISFVAGIPGRIMGAIGNLAALLTSKGRDMINGLKNGITSAFGSVIAWVGGIGSKILSAVGNLAHTLYNAGRAVIEGLLRGITSMFTSVKNKLGDLASSIVSWKGPPPKDEVLLYNNGVLIMTGLIEGIESLVPDLQDTMEGLIPVMQATAFAPITVPPIASAPTVNIAPQAVSSPQVTTNVYGTTLTAQDVSDEIAWELRLNG